MISLAREARGITQSQLATKTAGLNQGNLSKMEKGILNIPETILSNIANVLSFPVSFFYKSEPKVPINSFYYRKKLTIPKKVSMVFNAEMNILRGIFEDILNTVNFPDFELPSIDITDFATPKDAAIHIRDVLKINNGPIQNLISILEENGIVIYFLNADDRFDGITLFTDSGIPIMFINKNMPNDRKRFTIGHELGHLIMHIPFIHFRDSDEIEREANQFSAEFNMPESECRPDLIRLKYSNLGHLKDYWKMSKAAIIYRAKEIGTINGNTYKYLIIELSRRGERKRETGIVFLDRPVIIKQIIDLYKEELGYSLDELTELMSISIGDFNKYFNRNQKILRIA